MAIDFAKSEIEAFFGTERLVPNVDSSQINWFIKYSGRVLNYEVLFCGNDETISISGASDEPFGADSIFEFNVACNLITTCPDGYYNGETGLLFKYGNAIYEQNTTMMLLKRPDGDLKVWPSPPWPMEHPLNFNTGNADPS